MKKMKVLSYLMSIMIFCISLSGCMTMTVETKINDDYSGTSTLTVGFLKEMYDALPEEEKASFELDASQVFEYDGKEYIGGKETIQFRNVVELSTMESQQDSTVNSGTEEYIINEDGEIELTYIVPADVGMTEEAKKDVANGASMSGVTTMEEYDALFDSIIIKNTVEFPKNVKQISGPAVKSIVINGNILEIDIMKISEELGGKEEMFKFVTTSQDSTVMQKIVFDDVAVGDWFYEQVYKMVDQGLFVGKTDKMFCPKDTMTKAEFITVIARMIYDEETLKTFKKNETVWWDGYYNACLKDGIFTGEQVPCGNMDKGIKREEMAFIASAFLTKIKNESGADVIVPVVMSQIPDKNLINDDYKDGVAYCYSKGILCGINEKGTFNPQATLTRAEATTVIDRILNKDARVLKD